MSYKWADISQQWLNTGLGISTQLALTAIVMAQSRQAEILCRRGSMEDQVESKSSKSIQNRYL